MVAWLLGTLGPLWWMWIFAPFLAAFVYVLAAKDDPKRAREIERWRKAFGPHQLDVISGYREQPKAVASKVVPQPPPAVTALPSLLSRMLRTFGGGELLAHYELVPKLAYLSVVGANGEQSSDFQAVVGKLEAKRGPAFTVHPIPIVEGVPQPNTGIEFPKDKDFTDLFVVEAILAEGQPATPAATKAIRKWLSQPVRDALKELPEAWVRVEGQAMLVAYYGAASAEVLNQLILAADTLFAEHGAGGGPSLFGDPDEEEDEDDDEEAASAPAGKLSPKEA